MIIIDPDSDTPAFEQLRLHLVEQIDTGQLLVGTRLPAVRTLATDLGLAANTVAKTYRSLESDGYVETHGRGGTLVAGTAPRSAAAEALAAEYAAGVRALGLSPADALRLARAALDS